MDQAAVVRPDLGGADILSPPLPAGAQGTQVPVPSRPEHGVFAAFALEAYPWVTRWAFHTRSGRVVCGVLIVLNALGFLVRTALPARQEIGLQRAIYYSLPKRLLIVRGNDPYLIGGRPSHFYRDPAPEVGNLTDVGGRMVRGIIREPALIALPTGTPVDTVQLSCQALYQTFPDWVIQSPIWPRLTWAEPKPWTLRRCVAR
jgi:hypothetical protein